MEFQEILGISDPFGFRMTFLSKKSSEFLRSLEDLVPWCPWHFGSLDVLGALSFPKSSKLSLKALSSLQRFRNLLEYLIRLKYKLHLMRILAYYAVILIFNCCSHDHVDLHYICSKKVIEKILPRIAIFTYISETRLWIRNKTLKRPWRRIYFLIQPLPETT